MSYLDLCEHLLMRRALVESKFVLHVRLDPVDGLASFLPARHQLLRALIADIDLALFTPGVPGNGRGA